MCESQAPAWILDSTSLSPQACAQEMCDSTCCDVLLGQCAPNAQILALPRRYCSKVATPSLSTPAALPNACNHDPPQSLPAMLLRRDAAPPMHRLSRLTRDDPLLLPCGRARVALCASGGGALDSSGAEGALGNELSASPLASAFVFPRSRTVGCSPCC